MTQSERETMPGARERKSAIRTRMEGKLPLVFLGMLIAGTIGALAFDVRWAEAIANHLRALGVVGLLASLAGYIAKKKGRDHRSTFVISSLIPIGLGVVAVILAYFMADVVYCGGGVIPASALLVIIGYARSWRRQAGHARV